MNLVELPPPPPPYVPPPLDLLPRVLQDYVHAAAESLNVDVSFILLPLLSALGSAIGNSRSIILKRGFIQPPVIWTGIIGPTGSLKSPGLEAGSFPVLEHERELKRQNQQAQELFEEDHATVEKREPKEARTRAGETGDSYLSHGRLNTGSFVGPTRSESPRCAGSQR